MVMKNSAGKEVFSGVFPGSLKISCGAGPDSTYISHVPFLLREKARWPETRLNYCAQARHPEESSYIS